MEETKNKHGGSRPGSGRKSVKRLFRDLSLTKKRKAVMSHITNDDIKKIVRAMVDRALISSVDAKYLLDQFIGRPLQATDITSGGEKIESFNDKQITRIADRIAKRRAGNGGTSSS